MHRAMARKLAACEAVDVSACRRTVTGDYLLDTFRRDIDYCDAKTEQWIWSIGKTVRPLTLVMADNERVLVGPGTYLASTTQRHYEDTGAAIQCVWLR